MRFVFASFSIVAGVLALSIAALPTPASACSPATACQRSATYPIWFGQTPVVPLNTTAFEAWPRSYSSTLPATDAMRVERFDGVTWQPLTAAVTPIPDTAGFVIRPVDALVSDTRYRIFPGLTDCSATEFTTTAAAPLPGSLGTLHATTPTEEMVQGSTFVGGICAYRVMAMVSIVTIDLAPDAQPWSSMLFYEARVDGAPFVGDVELGTPGIAPRAGSTHHGHGSVRLAAACAPVLDPNGAPMPFDHTALSEGEHTVVFRARVAGSDAWLETAPITVALRCPETADAGVDAGGDAGPTAGHGGCTTSPAEMHATERALRGSRSRWLRSAR